MQKIKRAQGTPLHETPTAVTSADWTGTLYTIHNQIPSFNGIMETPIEMRPQYVRDHITDPQRPLNHEIRAFICEAVHKVPGIAPESIAAYLILRSMYDVDLINLPIKDLIDCIVMVAKTPDPELFQKYGYNEGNPFKMPRLDPNASYYPNNDRFVHYENYVLALISRYVSIAEDSVNYVSGKSNHVGQYLDVLGITTERPEPEQVKGSLSPTPFALEEGVHSDAISAIRDSIYFTYLQKGQLGPLHLQSLLQDGAPFSTEDVDPRFLSFYTELSIYVNASLEAGHKPAQIAARFVVDSHKPLLHRIMYPQSANSYITNQLLAGTVTGNIDSTLTFLDNQTLNKLSLVSPFLIAENLYGVNVGEILTSWGVSAQITQRYVNTIEARAKAVAGNRLLTPREKYEEVVALVGVYVALLKHVVDGNLE